MSRCDRGKVKQRGRRKNGWSRRWDQKKASMAITGGDGVGKGRGSETRLQVEARTSVVMRSH